MNWDSVINIGMVVVGVTAMIVAMAHLCFGDFEEDEEEDILPFHPDEVPNLNYELAEAQVKRAQEWLDKNEELVERELEKLRESDHTCSTTCSCTKDALKTLQDQIDFQMDPILGMMVVSTAVEVLQDIVDKDDIDWNDLPEHEKW